MGTQLGDLISSIYDSAVDRSQWQATLSGLAGFFRASSAGIFSQDLRTDQVALAVTLNLSDEFLQSYATHYAAINPLLKVHAGTIHEGMLNTTEQTMPRSQFVRTEFYDGLFRPYRLLFEMGACLHLNSSIVSNLSLMRSDNRDSFDEGDLRNLSALVPHLQRALDIQRRIATAETRAEGLEAMLDRMRGAVFLTRFNGELILANDAAAAVLERREGLVISGRELRATDAQSTRALRAAIAAAASPLERGHSARVRIPRPGRRPLIATVVPVFPRSSQEPSVAMAAVFVSDPDARIRPSEAILMEMFDLTAAEASIAAAVASGQSLEEIANARDTSVGTVRTQLKAAFAKTNTRRQAELVALVTAISAGGGN